MESKVFTGTKERMANDYTTFIELSNKCRDIYNSRLLKAEHTKDKLNIQPGSTRQSEMKNTSMGKAMEKLREEMSTLIDQDMSLMCQILTLNEAVEDLKSRREYHYRKRLDDSSSCGSLWSVSTDDLRKSDTVEELHQKYPSPSTLSLHSRISRSYDVEDVHSTPKRLFTNISRKPISRQTIETNCIRKGSVESTGSRSRSRRYIETEFSSYDSPISVYVDDNSFDSGIDEPTTPLETSV
ncbi:hypothetical protein ScPMuIL_001719 [Solemya velum]